MNLTLQLLSHNLVFLFHLISFGKTHIHSLTKHASQKLGFFAKARGFFSSSHLLFIYKSQIRLSMEHCSHIWGGTPKSTLCVLDKVQSKAIRLINHPNLTKSLQPPFPPSISSIPFHLLQILSHALFSGDQGFYSSYSEACQDHQKLNSFTPFPSFAAYFTNSHKSSFIPRPCNSWNVLPSSCFPESYNLPSFKSKISKLDLISLSA